MGRHMTVPRLHERETNRIAALEALGILDTEPEWEFDALVEMASTVSGLPISLISLVDQERQWFKANTGLDGISETPREQAFCAHTILGTDLLEIGDALEDPRFRDNPLVTGDPRIRFYAGVPLLLSNGNAVGSICVIDREPGELSNLQRRMLRVLAGLATRLLEGRQARNNLNRTIVSLGTSESRFKALAESSPVGIYHTDEKLNRTFVNQTWLDIWARSPEDVLGANWRKHIHPDDRAAADDAYVRAIRDKRDFENNYRIIRPDGSIRHVHSKARPLLNASGEITDFIGTLEDVTERNLGELALLDAHDRMRIATDSGGIGIWDWNLATGELFWDDWTRRIYGLPPGSEPLTFQTFAHFVHPDDVAVVNEATRRAISDDEPLDIEFRITWDDGSRHYLKATGRVRRDARGVAVRMIGANIDITEPRSLSEALTAQHELLRVTLDSIGDAVITTDRSGKIVWLNPVAERMTGWRADDARGHALNEVFNIINETTREPCEDPVEVCLTSGQVTGLAHHTVLISRDGTEFGIEDSAAPIRRADGELLGVVLVFHDVTEQRRLASEMSYRASHDALTGLVNRAEFENRLRQALQRSHEEDCAHSLVYLDLDQFKVVNDTCGHAVGDGLLKQVAKLFRDAVRDSDIVGRLGGDEFAIILGFCSPDKARRVAQGICDRMNEFRFMHDGRRFRVGTSIGVVPVDRRWTSIAAILQAADSACYVAKEAGRNRVHIWKDSDTIIQSRTDEMQWTTLIEQALDEDGFELYAQRIEPIGPTKTPAPGIYAEVLLRMNKTSGAPILPGRFLPAAERFHLASRMDRWVVDKTIRWMQATPHLHDIATLSVNLSGQTVGDRACHRWILDQIADAGEAIAHRLCFEITETAAITNMIDASRFVEQLRQAGLKVALDDFGAGASSFGYLKKLTVDILKIDGQFIHNVSQDRLDDAAVRCFADVARVTGMQTVAECVETDATLSHLAKIGIDYAQGFLLKLPGPIDHLFD